jgi:hypothetical protein
MPIQISISNCIGNSSLPGGGLPPVETFYLLLEDSGRILLEDGISFLLTEAAP